MSDSPYAAGGWAYRALYALARRSPALNHLAHRVVQSEAIQVLPGYRAVYTRLIRHKSAQYLHRPTCLEIEATNACNARCVMCPREVHKGGARMAQDLFERICTQARDLGIATMHISGGEPLLDEGLFDKIRFAKSVGFDYICLFTNGSLLNGDRARELLGTGLDSLTWSIDAADKETYERIRVNLRFDEVVENLRRFLRLRAELGQKTPVVRVNMVCLPENAGRRRAFRRFFAPLADVVEVIDSHNYAGAQAGLTHSPAQEYGQKTRYPCHLLFCKAVVNAEGQMKKCGVDFSPEAVMGDLTRQSLQEVLESPRLLALKRRHLEFDFSEPGCDVCTHKESWWTLR